MQLILFAELGYQYGTIYMIANFLHSDGPGMYVSCLNPPTDIVIVSLYSPKINVYINQTSLTRSSYL